MSNDQQQSVDHSSTYEDKYQEALAFIFNVAGRDHLLNLLDAAFWSLRTHYGVTPHQALTEIGRSSSNDRQPSPPPTRVGTTDPKIGGPGSSKKKQGQRRKKEQKTNPTSGAIGGDATRVTGDLSSEKEYPSLNKRPLSPPKASKRRLLNSGTTVEIEVGTPQSDNKGTASKNKKKSSNLDNAIPLAVTTLQRYLDLWKPTKKEKLQDFLKQQPFDGKLENFEAACSALFWLVLSRSTREALHMAGSCSNGDFIVKVNMDRPTVVEILTIVQSLRPFAELSSTETTRKNLSLALELYTQDYLGIELKAAVERHSANKRLDAENKKKKTATKNPPLDPMSD